MTLDQFITEYNSNKVLLHRKLFNEEPATMICSDCGDLFPVGRRCKNYIKGKMEHSDFTHHHDNYSRVNSKYCRNTGEPISGYIDDEDDTNEPSHVYDDLQDSNSYGGSD